MDALISKVKLIAEANPSVKILRDTLTHLDELQRSTGQARVSVWSVVRHDFDLLEAQGLWENTEEQARLLETIGPSPQSSRTGQDISIVQPPPISATLPMISTVDLPLELVELLNHVYFLHLLANDSSKVLPPGKSLLSVMSRSHLRDGTASEPLPNLHDKVEDIVHRAFWKEALESLSSPEPSKQLPRLKFLYNDLLAALTPLLPPQHPIITVLSSPLSPTPAPLLSALNHIREILVCLRQRCAPARDEYIDTLIHHLDDPLPPSSPSSLAQLIVDTFRSIMKLTDAMKDDLSQFVLGTMGEKQLKSTIVHQAVGRERNIILDIWKPSRIEANWKVWFDELQMPENRSTLGTPRNQWRYRLVQALGSTLAISCNLPTLTTPLDPRQGDGELASPESSPGNSLPPPFFFSAPSLLYLQNYLQALVVAASLRSLTHLPPSAKSPKANSVPPSVPTLPDHSEGSDFMERVWSLLKAEVDEEQGAGDTKLVNLADEVVRARAQFAVLDAAEETRLRVAVERTLQPRDPVFLLLQKRLMDALAARLCQNRPALSLPPTGAPDHMRAGRDGERAGKRPRLALDLSQNDRDEAATGEEEVAVKGFEHPVLTRAIREALVKLRNRVNWVEEVWRDLVENGTLELINEVDR